MSHKAYLHKLGALDPGYAQLDPVVKDLVNFEVLSVMQNFDHSEKSKCDDAARIEEQRQLYLRGNAVRLVKNALEAQRVLSNYAAFSLLDPKVREGFVKATVSALQSLDTSQQLTVEERTYLKNELLARLPQSIESLVTSRSVAARSEPVELLGLPPLPRSLG